MTTRKPMKRKIETKKAMDDLKDTASSFRSYAYEVNNFIERKQYARAIEEVELAFEYAVELRKILKKLVTLQAAKDEPALTTSIHMQKY